MRRPSPQQPLPQRKPESTDHAAREPGARTSAEADATRAAVTAAQAGIY
ncbi:MAG TPA: hypothetical protein VGN81_36850 [Pseudonocardiaceae bacterium]|jgi:hypothetical protein